MIVCLQPSIMLAKNSAVNTYTPYVLLGSQLRNRPIQVNDVHLV